MGPGISTRSQPAMMTSEGITQLLADWSNGDQAALEKLMPIVYGELRRLAKSYLRHERPDHTLQPTALVHEAYLRLIDQSAVTWQNRAHFFGIAAEMIRRVLVNHAVARQAEKRGGPVPKLSLDKAVDFFQRQDLNLVALDHALTGLALVDPQQSRIVELRFFGGLTIEETAEILRLSPSTIKREWSVAKLWLLREIDPSEKSAKGGSS
jgi:RNA polymerase sigma factor (TIGR02999 family)